MHRSIVLALFAAVTVSASAAAQQPARELGRNTDTWRWDGRVEAGRWMHIYNVNGAVDFLPSTDNMVHVVAVKKARNESHMDEIHFEVVQVGGNVTICAIWNRRARCEDGGYETFRNKGNNETHSNVRFTVRVPKNVRVGANSVNGGVSVRDVGAEVRANTVNGGVEVRNASGRVKASSVNGTVDVNTASGPVSASTVNGNVEAKMNALSTTDDMSFKTVNGSVTVIVPASFDANFRFDTVHGSIDSDFPMTITGRFGPRHASGTIGSGGVRHIRASTVNGGIELRKQEE